jgi:signal peptide peptidase SppA
LSAKNYPHILAKLRNSPLIMTDRHIQAVIDVLDARLSGEHRTMPMMDDPDEMEDPEPEVRGSKLVIPIFGIIGKHCSAMEMRSGGCDLDQVDEMLEAGYSDSSIGELVLNIRSPGGTVTGIPETAKRIAAIAELKEVIAFTDSECCSGALWLASQANRFYCTESADIGSVGVRMVMLDQSRALENEGVKVNEIVSGKFKTAGAWWKPLTAEEKAMFQAQCDSIGAQFRAVILSKRAVRADAMEGQIFMGKPHTGPGAVDVGFCDGLVDSLDDLL